MLIGNEVLATNKVGGVKCGEKLIGKCGKLLKTRKTSEDKKLVKSKKLSKSRNSPNFDAKDSKPSFLIPEAKAAFNHIWLAFTKAPIL